MSAASTSIAASLGLTQPRKRATPVLGPDKALSPSTTAGSPGSVDSLSIYSPELEERAGGIRIVDDEDEEDVVMDGPKSALEWSKSDAIHEESAEEVPNQTEGDREEEQEGEEDEAKVLSGIRLIEAPFASTPSDAQGMFRQPSVSTLNRPWIGRSISYHNPPEKTSFVPHISGPTLPLVAGDLPNFAESAFKSLPPLPPASSRLLPFPRAPSLKERSSSNRSFASLARPILGYSFKRTSSRSSGSIISRSSSYAASSVVSSVQYTSKWPDRWYSAALARAESLEEQQSKVKRGWTRQKWLMLVSIATLMGYGMAGVCCSFVTWFRTWPHADVVIVTDTAILLYMTLAAVFCLLTAFVGLVGALLDSRPILAMYTFLLWPAGFGILVVGYSSYRKQSLSLDLKLNQAWSQIYDDLARLIIQDSLHCCGYYSPFHDATFSKSCYPRTSLPGCKGRLFRFERQLLRRCYLAAFGTVPVHIANIFIATICANHINRTFGKGLMPRAYRLRNSDVRENALSVLQRLSHPSSVRRRNTTKSVASISTLSSMPSAEPGSGLFGLGFKDETEETQWEEDGPGTEDGHTQVKLLEKVVENANPT